MLLRKGESRPGGPVPRWAASIAVWICFIWGHSLVKGPESSAESGFVYTLLAPLFNSLGVVDADTCVFIIRKCAHFSEYAVLGILSVGLARALVRGGSLAKDKSWFPTLCCAAVPVIDETIQLFVPGRSGSPRDVAIDLFGMLTGACLATLVVKLRQKA